MPVDQEQIKKALDAFEDDEFVDAKEILQKEISKAKEEYLTKKLKLKDSEKDGGDEDGAKEGSEEGKKEGKKEGESEKE